MTQAEQQALRTLNNLYGTASNPIRDTEELYDDEYCRWDFESDNLIIEFKDRAKHFPSGMMIDVKKFNAVVSQAELTGKHPMFAVQTPEGLFVWLLTAVKDINWVDMHLQKNNNPNDSRKIMKKVAFLKFENAVKVM